MVNLSLPDIDSNLQPTQSQGINETARYQTNSSLNGNERLSPASPSTLQTPSLDLLKRKPIYSFVYLSNTFPVADCFLRSFDSIPGKVPRQSAWAKETMNKSIKALKNHTIDMDPLINIIGGPEFCAESLDIFLDCVLLLILHSLGISAPEDMYLHVYLIVSTLIFPIVFSTRKEISNRNKVRLRISLNNFSSRLEGIPMEATLFCNLMSFVRIIKTMTTFSKLLLSEYKTSATRDILRAMIGDTQMDKSMDGKFFEDMIIREAFIACNAFNWEFLGKNLGQSSMHHILQNITNAYVKLAIYGSQKILRIPDLMSDQDFEEQAFEMLYHLFEIMVKAFHTVFINHTAVLQLPIKVVSSFLNLIIKEFQNLSFRHFSNRDPELSKEIFRAVGFIQA